MGANLEKFPCKLLALIDRASLIYTRFGLKLLNLAGNRDDNIWNLMTG